MTLLAKGEASVGDDRVALHLINETRIIVGTIAAETSLVPIPISLLGRNIIGWLANRSSICRPEVGTSGWLFLPKVRLLSRVVG